jgi:rhodanese-related sulfurtransferase
MIDVRGRDEVDLPRIPGACAVPLDELPSELGTLDRERPVVFVGTARKAAAAMKALRSAAITASAVEGGIRTWRKAGLPIEHGVSQDPLPPP